MILLPALVVSVAVLMPSAAPVFGVTVVSAAQDAAAVEAALRLDRPTRRLIQQGLSNEGFDPGTPDGLFGPRTRSAIRTWQAARNEAQTGYLDGQQAATLQAAAVPRPVIASPARRDPAPVSDAPASLEISDPGLPAAATDTQSSETPDTPTPPAAKSSEAPTRASRPRERPPEILIDRRLVRVDRLLARDDHRTAHEVMNEILTLQREHALELPAEFHFKYAQVALASGLPETAVESLNDYLLVAGREGEFYREALELLNSAEEAVRRADAARRQAEAARQRAEAERHRAEAQQRENDNLARRQKEVAAVPLPRDRLRSGGLAPEMVTVPAGHFQYFTRQEGQYSSREHVEWVTFDRPFAIGKYEITLGEFEIFVDRARYRTEARREPEYGCAPHLVGRFLARRNSRVRWDRPGFDQTDRHPVICVSVQDAMAYATWLSEETGHSYRLPSAAEWQYAARAGSPEAMLFVGREDPVSPDACRYGHIFTCFSRAAYTVEVGRLLPNGIGLHDIVGNAEEIVLACRHRSQDSEEELSRWYGSGHLLTRGSLENPQTCEYYVATMGGSWSVALTYQSSGSLRVSTDYRPGHKNMGFESPYFRNSQTWTGFRLVRRLP